MHRLILKTFFVFVQTLCIYSLKIRIVSGLFTLESDCDRTFAYDFK